LSAGTTTAIVRGPNLGPLVPALQRLGLSGSTEPDGSLRVQTENLAQIGNAAFANQVELHELSLEEFDLERLFFSLTDGEYQAQSLDQPPTRPDQQAGAH